MSWIWIFLLETPEDYLGPSPEAIGSTWFRLKAPFSAPWKIEQIEGSKSFGDSKCYNSSISCPILTCSISKWPYSLPQKFAILQSPSSQKTNHIMTKRGQTIEANFLHEPRVWRTSFLWPRRSDMLCRSRILPKVCSHELGKVIFFNFHDFHFSLTIFRTRFWPRGHVPRGCSANKNWRSWKANMFRHQNF